MKFELKRLTDYSDEEIIKEIKRVAGLVTSDTLTRKEFAEHSRASPSTIRRRFGGWKKALEAAGLEDRWAQSASFGLGDEEFLDEMRRVARELGVEQLTKKDFNANSELRADAIVRRFGSWPNALARVGLEQNPIGRRYTDEECFENLLDVWTHYGRQPMYREMGNPPSKITGKAYMRFGSWTKALHAFVDRVNHEQSEDEEITVELESTSSLSEIEPAARSTASHGETRDIRLGLRFQILHRDCFKCVLCGNSPATDPKCRLHVDHITPFSKGGKSVATNLRTLCEMCNIGRSNKYTD